MNRFFIQAALATTMLLPAVSATEESTEPSEVIPEGHLKSADCPAWVEKTYRIEAVVDDLDLDLADMVEDVRACVARDSALMKPVIPFGWCDNILKIHCAGLDLITEIGEAEIGKCERSLEDTLGIAAREHRAWKTCGQNVVYDRYSQEGELNEPDDCRKALLDGCGTNIDAELGASELSEERGLFVACCSASALDPERGESDRCGMIDSGFTRGPCMDRPICVNRLTAEWISCSG